MTHPIIIQGGMGAGVSDWRLAKAVSHTGQLGVVSGTALDLILLRRLQLGDPGGHMRRAMKHFPDTEMADRVLDKFYTPGGCAESEPFKTIPMFNLDPDKMLKELTVVANFTEVFLAKEGHKNPVGINLLEKIQLPTLFALYGAMLAGVDYVIMGAGIPREIPGTLDRLADHKEASLRIAVEGSTGEDDFHEKFDPVSLLKKKLPGGITPRREAS